MLWRAVTVAAVALAVPGSVSAVSPAWCKSEALNASEGIICVDGILSRLDIELHDAYDAARRVAPDLDQASWLSERDSCGTDVSCLERAYRTRISELREIASGQPGLAEGELGTDSQWYGDEDTDDQPWHGGRSQASTSYGDDGGTSDEVVGALGSALGGLVSRHLVPALDQMVPRPWCDAGRLNVTERTICEDPDLSRLDALLELVYGRTDARDEDQAQNAWLRSERDACGADRLCIANSYAERIEQLDNAGAIVEQPRRDLDIPAGHHPPPGTCRVWYPGLPPGQQPPPSSCDVFVPDGAVLVEGG